MWVQSGLWNLCSGHQTALLRFQPEVEESFDSEEELIKWSLKITPHLTKAVRDPRIKAWIRI